ncbi:hypothetical protein AB0H76_32850 [Nocardia sp. NPDC050712]|uniref:hypothetical protein n=1 Tax=Nocardia sp. NPDC050712 TaxID=3155518 RepID=UPI0033C3B3D7
MTDRAHSGKMQGMGVYCERIVDLEATEADGARLATRIIDWLVAEGILTREMTREQLYSDYAEEGYAPGPNWRRITLEDWGTGPVAVALGRNTFAEGQGMDTPEFAKCPACAADTVIIDFPSGQWEPDRAAWEPLAAGIEAWQRTGVGAARCAACDTTSPIPEWRWSSGFALSSLAFEFWDWPPLTEEFQQELAARLGHTIVRQVVKL